MKTAACHFGNHQRCKGEIQGTWFEKCDCDCHVTSTEEPLVSYDPEHRKNEENKLAHWRGNAESVE